MKKDVTVDVFQTSRGRDVFSEAQRRIRFTKRKGSFTWKGKAKGGKKLKDGVYYVRFRIRDANNRLDSRRLVVERKNGRFKKKTGYVLRDRCA